MYSLIIIFILLLVLLGIAIISIVRNIIEKRTSVLVKLEKFTRTVQPFKLGDSVYVIKHTDGMLKMSDDKHKIHSIRLHLCENHYKVSYLVGRHWEEHTEYDLWNDRINGIMYINDLQTTSAGDLASWYKLYMQHRNRDKSCYNSDEEDI